ncbi:MAG: hypothetical protein JST75_12435 [Bacteroidetes bacterium]|nr:hypothetical protein [Bacteroidota bacterium]
MLVNRLLAMGALAIIFYRRNVVNEQERDMLMYLSFTMMGGVAILGILYLIKPRLFNDKSSQQE